MDVTECHTVYQCQPGNGCKQHVFIRSGVEQCEAEYGSGRCVEVGTKTTRIDDNGHERKMCSVCYSYNYGGTSSARVFRSGEDF